ncbi:MAG TPA: putative glycolipid-binding domain-containing protein [Micromonosporaceae bacterium]|jgi:hypothetical protein
MTTQTALFWRRTDTAGAEHAVCVERTGLRARGTAMAATPVPYVCRYEVLTDDAWASARCDVSVEGAGFLRSLRMERATGRWRITATEQGTLDAALLAAGQTRADQPGCEDPGRLLAALDIDLAFSPLTNTLPIRRLGLLEAPGDWREIEVAWILLPSLEVVPSTQTYRSMGNGEVQFASGTFSAQITVDERGYVRDYPGLAERAG